MTEQNYLLGLDAGTSVIKASLYDTDGNRISTASRKTVTHTPHPDWSEQDMDALWGLATETIREVIEHAQINPATIAAIGPSGQGDGAWLLDANYEPVRAAALWNDNRAGAIVQQWEESGVLDKVFERTGTVIWPGTVAGVLAWLRDHDPDAFKRVDKLISSKDWIKYKLTGVLCTDETDASIPFMRLADYTYDDDVLEMLGLSMCRSILPEFVPSHQVIGHVTTEAAAACGLVAGIPVVSGQMDLNANGIGIGAIGQGQAFTILGTTGINCVIMNEADFAPFNVGATACHSVPGHYVRLLGAMAGTPNLEWYLDSMGSGLREEAERTGQNVFDYLDGVVSKVDAGSGGVVFHPYLQGERAPFLSSTATGGFFGITAGTTREQLARAVYEGVAFSVKHCYSTMGRPNQVLLAGGGSASETWCQMLANMVNCRVSVPAGDQFGTLGAALTAGVGVGIYADYAAATRNTVKIEREYAPNAKQVAVYDALFPLYVDLVEQVSGFWSGRRAAIEKISNLTT